jgi:WD40 repeat protein
MSAGSPKVDGPYPGLRPFRSDEAEIFFGRDEQVDAMLKRLGASRFLAVVGESGCGKSSLVSAGLIPALELGLLTPPGPAWRIAPMRPGSHPLNRLATALLSSGALPGFEESPDPLGMLSAQLRRGPMGLCEALDETPLPDGESLLLLVDQFEEIFRFFAHGGDRDEAIAFVNLILMSLVQTTAPVYVVLAIRSDYFGDCARFFGLPEAICNSLFLVPRLTRQQRQEAIVSPAIVAGGTIEPGLVNQLLNEFGGDPDQLPLTQHALLRLWSLAKEREGADAVKLDTALWARIGKERALNEHADEVFLSLPSDQRGLAECIFRCLTEQNPEHRPTRRPTGLKTLAEVANVSLADLAPVVEIFRTPGTSFLTPPSPVSLMPYTVLDISHESLIRQWKRLQEWVNREAESAELYRRCAQTASLWERAEAPCLQSPELDHVLAWWSAQQPIAAWADRYGGQFELVRRFLEASLQNHREEKRQIQSARERQLRLTRQVLIGTFTCLLISSGLLAWALFQRSRALNAIEQRDQNKTLLENAQLAAEEADQKLRHAMLTAKNAEDEVKIIEAKSKEIRNHAERNRKLVQSGFLASDADRIARDQPQLGLLLADKALRTLQPIAMPSDAGYQRSLRDGEAGFRRAAAMIGGHGLWAKQDRIRDLEIDQSGCWLATGSDDGSIALWDLKATDPAARPILRKDDEKPVLRVKISPDSGWLAVRRQDGKVQIYTMTSSGPSHRPISLTVEGSETTSISFSPNSRWLLTAGSKGYLRLWDLRENHPGSRPALTLSGEEPLSTWKFSRDSRWLGILTAASVVLVWDLSGHEPNPVKFKEQARKGTLFCAGFDSENRFIIVQNDASAQTWDPSNPAAEPGPLSLSQKSVSNTKVIAADAGGVKVVVEETLTDKPERLHRFWDLSDPKKAKRSVSLAGIIGAQQTRLTVSKDGRWLLLRSYGEDAGLFRLDQEGASSEPTVLGGHAGRVTGAAFSPDSRLVATFGGDNSVRVWSLLGEDPLSNPAELVGHDAPVSALGFGRLVTASDDGTARVWTMSPPDPELNPTRIVKLDTADGAQASEDRRWLAIACADGVARLWDLQEADLGKAMTVLDTRPAKPRPAPPGTEDAVLHLDIASSRWLVAIDAKRVATRWDLQASPRTARSTVLLDLSGQVLRIGLSPDGQWLAVATRESRKQKGQEGGKDRIRLWSLKGAESKSETIEGPYNQRGSMEFSRDGRWCAAITGPELRLLDLHADHPAAKAALIRVGLNSFKKLFFSADSRWLIAVSSDGSVLIWDLSQDDPGTRVTSLPGGGRGLEFAAISPTAGWLVLGDEGGKVRLWKLGEADPAKPPIRLPREESLTGIFQINFNSAWMNASLKNGTCRLWHLGERLQEIDLGQGIQAGFNDDGRWLGIRGSTSLTLWDLRDPPKASKFPAQLMGLDVPIYRLAVSPQSHQVATGSRDGRVHLWNTQPGAGTLPVVLDAHHGPVEFLVPSHDRLVTLGNEDGSARFWDLSIPRLMEKVRSTVGRELSADERARYLRDDAEKTSSVP